MFNAAVLRYDSIVVGGGPRARRARIARLVGGLRRPADRARFPRTSPLGRRHGGARPAPRDRPVRGDTSPPCACRLAMAVGRAREGSLSVMRGLRSTPPSRARPAPGDSARPKVEAGQARRTGWRSPRRLADSGGRPRRRRRVTASAAGRSASAATGRRRPRVVGTVPTSAWRRLPRRSVLELHPPRPGTACFPRDHANRAVAVGAGRRACARTARALRCARRRADDREASAAPAAAPLARSSSRAAARVALGDAPGRLPRSARDVEAFLSGVWRPACWTCCRRGGRLYSYADRFTRKLGTTSGPPGVKALSIVSSHDFRIARSRVVCEPSRSSSAASIDDVGCSEGPARAAS